MRPITSFAIALLVAAATGIEAQSRFDPEAVRLNNRGVAQMDEQFTDRAVAAFSEAFKKDPTLAQAEINRGIALLSTQKLPEAKKAFEQGIALNPGNAQAWYNLGLVQHAANELESALASFQHASAIDSKDADSYYFEGVCYQALKQYDKALESLNKAIEIDPLHASAEFAIAHALQRSGQTAKAKDHFNRFQHLTSTKIGTPIGQSYGEQGHYSTATTVQASARPVRAMIPVRLMLQRMTSPETLARRSVPSYTTTGGACMMDVSGEGRVDLVMMQDGAHAIRVLRNNGDGTFGEWNADAAGLKASGRAVACAVGDYDGDGLNDLAVALDDSVLLYRNLGHGQFVNVTVGAGLKALNEPSGISFVDFDHDGDLDLLLTGSPLHPGRASNVLWRNNGNKTFTEWTQPTGLDGIGKTVASTLTDFNNDRAVDLVLTGDGSAPLIYVNPREGRYPTQPLYDRKPGGESLPSTIGLAVMDFDKDGWMDLAVTHTGAPGLTLWRNVGVPGTSSRRFQRVDLPLRNAKRGWGLTPIDIDNDGWIDLAAIVETNAGPAVRVFRNRGDGSFDDVSHALGLDTLRWDKPRGLIAADVDADGAADLIVTQINAPPMLLRNIGGNKNHSMRLNLTGFADNTTALGAKVEVFADGIWQKWELAGGSGYQTQGPQEILVGLGEAKGVDLLRILWPTGVLQDEIDLPHQPTIKIKETDRRGSSCPVLFAWDGHKFKLVTDVIGAGVVGHWFTQTRRNVPNPGEWIKVDGSKIVLVDGKLSLRFMEPMEEVNYIDQLRLVAVDHPENVEVNPDERFLDSPPFASGRVIATQDARPLVNAWDGEGLNARDRVGHRDHLFASGFTALPYDGFANLHALTLDIGEIKQNTPLRLLMTGYVNYFSATSLYAAWQAKIKPIPPYVEAQLPDGSWQRIADDVGFPAGLERTIVVDLTGKVPAGVSRIRLLTNLQIYWDLVLIDDKDEAEARTEEVPLATATLHFRGYPAQIDGASTGDLDYDYDRVSLTGPFQHQRGNYTHMGDVAELLNKIDDRFTIFGSGEEIAIRFDAARLQPLPAHWKRDYFFYANGFVKDMDWWDASPFTVDQLPFHRMSTYPYPASEAYPNDKDALDYQLNWNDRFDSGNTVRSYRFGYGAKHSTPDEYNLPASISKQPEATQP